MKLSDLICCYYISSVIQVIFRSAYSEKSCPKGYRNDLCLKSLWSLHSLVCIEVVLGKFEVSCRAVDEISFDTNTENSIN
jgi:hypothetical protein